MRWWPTYVSRMWSLCPRRACTASICSSPFAMARLLKGSLYLKMSMCVYTIGFEIATNGIQFYVFANLDKTSHCTTKPYSKSLLQEDDQIGNFNLLPQVTFSQVLLLDWSDSELDPAGSLTLAESTFCTQN